LVVPWGHGARRGIIAACGAAVGVITIAIKVEVIVLVIRNVKRGGFGM